jgi:transcriptional activator of cad operon
MQTTRTRFHVGDWLVEPRLNRITGAGGSVVVEPKVMHVLLLLAEHPGDVLTRDQLLERVWEGTVVTDYVVSLYLSAPKVIRRRAPGAPVYRDGLENGYRLVAPVTEELAENGKSVDFSGGGERNVPTPADDR